STPCYMRRIFRATSRSRAGWWSCGARDDPSCWTWAKTPVLPGSLANPERVYNGAMDAITIPCGICPSTIATGAVTCPGCGRPVTDQDRAVLQVRFEGADWQAHERGKKVRAGAKWVGVLAILFAVSAPLMFA